MYKPLQKVKDIRKSDVIETIRRGIFINLVGMGATLLGLQATVGLLVAKTLTNATVNPFVMGRGASWNPVLALDVFLVQASVNVILAHFVSVGINLWLLSTVSQGGGIPVRNGEPKEPEYIPISGQ
jgi:hypothetical protein